MVSLLVLFIEVGLGDVSVVVYMDGVIRVLE